MIQIDKTNFTNYEPLDLADMLHSGEATLIETGVNELGSIINYIIQAIGERKLLKKRVLVLEQYAQSQTIFNNKMLEELNALKQQKTGGN